MINKEILNKYDTQCMYKVMIMVQKSVSGNTEEV